jgi:hypothetical protein
VRRSKPIERYLAELATVLDRRGVRGGRLLREARAHLYASLRMLRRAGERDAERRALERFGTVEEIADELARAESTVPARPTRPRLALALLATLVVAGAGAVLAAGALERPVFGLLSTPQRGTKAGARPGIVYAPTTLVKLDPRTLRPVGKRLALGDWRPLALSPDGSRVALARAGGGVLRLVDLTTLKPLGDVAFAQGPNRTIATAVWLDDERLLALEQRMGGPYARQVKARTLWSVDTASRRVLRRRAFPTRRVESAGVAGGRWLLVLGDSDWRLPYVDVALVARDGSFRRVRVDVGRMPGRPHGPRTRVALAVDRSGSRAFLTTTSGRIFELDLGSLRVRVHSPSFRASGVAPAAVGVVQAATLDDNSLAVAGLARGRARHESLLGGVWRVDTHRWTARPFDRSGSEFEVVADTALVYGPTVRNGRLLGLGVRVYDVSGRLRFGILAGARIDQPLVVGDYLHTLVFGQTTPRAVFDVHTGRNLGRISRPPASLQLLGVGTPVAGG